MSGSAIVLLGAGPNGWVVTGKTPFRGVISRVYLTLGRLGVLRALTTYSFPRPDTLRMPVSFFVIFTNCTDCAVCAEGYGAGADNTCFSCTDTKSRWLMAGASFFALAVLLFFVVGISFLVGGLDAVEGIRRSVVRTGGRSVTRVAPPICESSFPVRRTSVSTRISGSSLLSDDTAAAPAVEGHGDSTGDPPSVDACGRKSTHCQDAATASPEAVGSVTPGRCGLFPKLKLWASRVPFAKIKILVVIWQILTAFPSISSVDFPPFYARFLSLIDFINFDIGAVVSASCIMPEVSFYHRLLLTTLAPLALALVLVLTYQIARRREGVGSASVIASKNAWSRHMAAGLLLSFLVRLSFFAAAARIT